MILDFDVAHEPKSRIETFDSAFRFANFINDHRWIKGKFCWQEGYGAFSYSHSQIAYVYDYILNQEKHHAEQTFKNEYADFLKRFEIEHDAKYLFEWLE